MKSPMPDGPSKLNQIKPGRIDDMRFAIYDVPERFRAKGTKEAKVLVDDQRKAALKRPHSKRFARFTAALALTKAFLFRFTSVRSKAPSPLPLCRRSP